MGASALDAAARFIVRLAAALPGLRIIRTDPDLVGVSDIARRIERSRQNVQQWVNGERNGGRPFPPPEGSAGRALVWRWADVNVWLGPLGLDDKAIRPSRAEAARIDVMLLDWNKTRVIGESGGVDRQRWDERYSGTEFEWSTRPNQFVAAELAGLPPGRALDLAAGEGRNTVWLAERGWRVTAVDFSRVGLDKGRKLSAARGVPDGQVDWVVADLTDYEPDHGAFDLVLVAYLQVDAALRAKVLAGAADALAPGGTLFIVGHDLTNLTEGVGGPQYSEVLYTPEAITAELAGLRILRAERVRRAVDRDGVSGTAIDTLVRAERL
jgi:SAM-dependent methyltransferase